MVLVIVTSIERKELKDFSSPLPGIHQATSTSSSRARTIVAICPTKCDRDIQGGAPVR